jgi:hypothetical protein
MTRTTLVLRAKRRPWRRWRPHGAAKGCRARSHCAAPPLDAFRTLSQALTARSGLDRDVGARLLAALEKSAPDLAPRLPQLAGALAAGSSSARDQALALRIMEGWYLGTVDNVVVTYEEALMYRVVSDTLIIRSYCPNKPGFWAAKPVEQQS